MTGPQVSWTYSDLVLKLKNNPLFLFYHAVSTPWDVFSPAGAVLGGLLAVWKRPALATMGTTSFVLGCTGAALGLVKLALTTQTDDWTEASRQRRVDALQQNFTVRLLDKCAWSGVVLGAIVYSMVGGRGRLSPGVWGRLQALSLGSSVGSLAAFSCILANKKKKASKD